jgi:hypothetical protein
MPQPLKKQEQRHKAKEDEGSATCSAEDSHKHEFIVTRRAQTIKHEIGSSGIAGA